MIGSAVSAGMQMAAQIYGGIKSAQAGNSAIDNIKSQLRENQDLYDRRYNEDATQRADAQRLLTITEDSLRKRNRRASGSAAVQGATEESAAAEKEASNRALSDAVSSIAAQADARKDLIEQNYMNSKANLKSQLANMELQKAQAISGAVQGVAGAASGIKPNLDGAFDKGNASQGNTIQENTTPNIPF